MEYEDIVREDLDNRIRYGSCPRCMATMDLKECPNCGYVKPVEANK